MIKFPVSSADHLENALRRGILLLGQNLAADIIDTCHMLSRKPTEIMSQGHAGPGMRIVVLNHVADILHSVRLAPGAKLSGKAFLHQPCYQIHVTVAHLGPQLRICVVVPEQGQQCLPV